MAMQMDSQKEIDWVQTMEESSEQLTEVRTERRLAHLSAVLKAM